MRNAAGQLPQLSKGLLEPGKNLIEGRGQVVQFVAGAGERKPLCEIRNLDFVRRMNDAPHRPEGASSQNPTCGCSENQAKWHEDEGNSNESPQRKVHGFHGNADLDEILLVLTGTRLDRSKSAAVHHPSRYPLDRLLAYRPHFVRTRPRPSSCISVDCETSSPVVRL